MTLHFIFVLQKQIKDNLCSVLSLRQHLIDIKQRSSKVGTSYI